jgi:ESCRT-II complex subunit VPS36
MPQIRAPLSLREFASGVKVVQADSHSDEAICRRLAQMVQPAPTAAAAQPRQGEEGAPGGPATSSAAAMAENDGALLAALGPSITSTEVAVGLGVPVPIAGEHLRTAEARGVLCRDDGPEGLRFFRNFFADASLAAVAG